MNDLRQQFIDRVDRLEKRYRRDRYADMWLMPRELMIKLRDELKELGNGNSNTNSTGTEASEPGGDNDGSSDH